MFIRSKVAKGETYYAVVEGYRDPADPSRVRHRQVISLGRSPDVPSAIEVAQGQLKGLRRRLARLERFGEQVPASIAAERARIGGKLAQQQARLACLREVQAEMSRPPIGCANAMIERERAEIDEPRASILRVQALLDAGRGPDIGRSLNSP